MMRRQTTEVPPFRLGATAALVGRGLVAGLAGTAAMTVSSGLEARLRRRDLGTAPARAAGRVLGVAPVDDRGEHRFNRIVHWAYGTAWGSMRGLLAAVGIPAGPADVAHLAAVWGAEQVVLPATGTSPAPTHGPRREIAADLARHAVYAAATGLAFRWLGRR
jgi:hypothetical protein